MNHHLAAVVEHDHDQLQHVPRPIHTEHQQPPRRVIITDLTFDGHMTQRMPDVSVTNPMASRRLMDLHTKQTYYTSRQASTHPEPAEPKCDCHSLSSSNATSFVWVTS